MSTRPGSKKTKDPPIQLTNRELEITALIARDMSDKQIARELKLSVRSITNLNYIIRLKIKVHTRVGMALWYARYYGFPKLKS